MMINIRSEKMVIISDLHIGNPFSPLKRQTNEFIRWAFGQGYDICINGDGLEIAQVSFQKLARDVPEFFRAIKSGKATCYYVVGNHDMALEHFLEDWGVLKVTPFLNVSSGDQRIRIEHGHLYDPFFVKHPDLYEFMTWIGGFALALHPSIYKVWIWLEKLQSKLRGPLQELGIPGEHPNFFHASAEILNRGFDSVVFGHTHHAGVVQFDNGKRYFNSGSWLVRPSYICIENGNIQLKQFDVAT